MTKTGIQIRPIRTKQDHEAAIVRIEELMSARPSSVEGDELDVLATLVDAYEAKHHAIGISADLLARTISGKVKAVRKR